MIKLTHKTLKCSDPRQMIAKTISDAILKWLDLRQWPSKSNSQNLTRITACDIVQLVLETLKDLIMIYIGLFVALHPSNIYGHIRMGTDL